MSEADTTDRKELFSRNGKRLQQRRLTPDEQLAIVKRVEAGESMAEIAREIGYSRQRISALCKKNRERGDDGMAPRKRGPKGLSLTEEQAALLSTMLTKQEPSDHGFEKKDVWTLEKSIAAGSKVIGRAVGKREMRSVYKLAGLQVVSEEVREEEELSEEFKAYLKSPLANEIREREKEYHERLAAEGTEEKKRGRPSKAEAEEREAKPWKLEYRDSDEPDEGLPAWDEMTPEQFAAMDKELKMATKKKSGSGTRVGKHRKGTAKQNQKKRKKKRRRR